MAFDLLQSLLTALKEMVAALGNRRLRFTLIGGLAVGYRSRPRFTRDIDFLLDIPQVALPDLLDELRERGFLFHTDKTIREWTRDHLTVLDYQGVRIDWLKPVLPLYQHVIDNARVEHFLDCDLPIASPECLILTKLLAFRSQDVVDVESLLAANPHIDVEFIRQEWRGIAAESDQRFVKFLELAQTSSPAKPPA